MPVLYLLRHAKSTWENPEISDHDRPLNERGQLAAPLIGKWLRENAPALDQALVSSAERAVETWKLVAAELKTEPAVTIDRSLYLAGPNHLLDALRQVGPAAETCLLIAHNPDLQQLALSLSDDLQSKGRRSLQKKFPTAGLAVLSFPGCWSGLDSGGATLTDFIRPRDLA
ncbi:MAG: histidine phosphatase family protein [Rhodospirillales bacterium]